VSIGTPIPLERWGIVESTGKMREEGRGKGETEEEGRGERQRREGGGWFTHCRMISRQLAGSPSTFPIM